MTGFKFDINTQISCCRAIEQGQIQRGKRVFFYYDPLAGSSYMSFLKELRNSKIHIEIKELP